MKLYALFLASSLIGITSSAHGSSYYVPANINEHRSIQHARAQIDLLPYRDRQKAEALLTSKIDAARTEYGRASSAARDAFARGANIPATEKQVDTIIGAILSNQQ